MLLNIAKNLNFKIDLFKPTAVVYIPYFVFLQTAEVRNELYKCRLRPKREKP